MNTPMMDNLLAAFKAKPPSPLYGKALVYLRGSSASTFRAIPGSAVAPPQNKNVIGTADKIASVNLSGEDGAGGTDPAAPGWSRNLTAQFVRAAADGYYFAELDNAGAYSVGTVQGVITMAHGYGISIVAKNPKLVGGSAGGALQIVSHQNVAGIVVERGAGMPAEYAAWRTQARKDGLLPIWFVFAGPEGAQQCAAQIQFGEYKGMGVSYSSDKNSYADSHTVLTPYV